MDTEITYKYKDGLHEDIKDGSLTLDKSVYKNFTGTYTTSNDDDINNLARRLWNCHLRATGDIECKAFLTDISNFCKDGEFETVYKWLMKQEMVEVIFQMY